MDLMTRRRAMMQAAAAGPVWPIEIEVPMTVKTICNGGKISSKTDWRSSGYIEIPTGATKLRWKNSDTGYTGFRAGLPDSDSQTTGITMLNSGSAITVAHGATSNKFSVGAHSYVYISRNGKNQSAITVIFLNE